MNPGVEAEEWVHAYHQAILANPTRALEHAACARSQWADRGTELLDWSGWPLRPFFFCRRKLDFLARELLRRLRAFGRLMGQAGPQIMHQRLGLPHDFLKQLSLKESLDSEELYCLMRPDGFLYDDRFILSEINFGNGVIVSNAYTEILHQLHSTDPLREELQLPPESLQRPFQTYLDMVERRISGKANPVVALLAHSEDYKTILSWEKRVLDQLQRARDLMERRGWRTRLVHETDVEVHQKGARLRDSREALDIVLQITIGTQFSEQPERLQTDLSMWTGNTVGGTPYIKPLAALCFEKAALPWLEEELPWPAQGDEFRLEVAHTVFPRPERRVEYQLQKEKYVLKRAFDGKDTRVGISSRGRPWNRTLARAVSSRDYVLQEYHPLPTTTVPVTRDGRTIEWLKVRLEVSPFVIDGEYSGGMVRYAPDAEGLVMSPPPESMGLGLMAAV